VFFYVPSEDYFIDNKSIIDDTNIQLEDKFQTQLKAFKIKLDRYRSNLQNYQNLLKQLNDSINNPLIKL
jgi:hypothetical protein